MKTTVEIPDRLLREARATAVRERTTLKALVEEGLRMTLRERKNFKPFRLRDGSYGKGGLRPELGNDWSKLRELAYEGRGA